MPTIEPPPPAPPDFVNASDDVPLEIRGEVRTFPGGAPVYGAQLSLYLVRNRPNRGLPPPLTVVTTDRDGRFRVNGLESTLTGLLYWVARAPEHVLASGSFSVPRTRRLDLALRPACHVQGSVLLESGRPAADAQVMIEFPHRATAIDRVGPRVQTSDDGSYKLDGIPLDEEFTVRAVRDDELRARPPQHAKTSQIDLQQGYTGRVPGEKFRCDFRLRRAAQLDVRVLLPDGSPAKHASVLVDMKSRLTDKNGWARFDGLPGGDLVVKVYPLGFPPFVTRATSALNCRNAVDVHVPETDE